MVLPSVSLRLLSSRYSANLYISQKLYVFSTKDKEIFPLEHVTHVTVCDHGMWPLIPQQDPCPYQFAPSTDDLLTREDDGRLPPAQGGTGDQTEMGRLGTGLGVRA